MQVVMNNVSCFDTDSHRKVPVSRGTRVVAQEKNSEKKKQFQNVDRFKSKN